MAYHRHFTRNPSERIFTPANSRLSCIASLLVLNEHLRTVLRISLGRPNANPGRRPLRHEAVRPWTGFHSHGRVDAGLGHRRDDRDFYTGARCSAAIFTGREAERTLSRRRYRKLLCQWRPTG